MPEISTLRLPNMQELSGLVIQYAPDVLKWSAIALAISIILRLLHRITSHKRSALLRMITLLALICGVAALGAYWVLTGGVPDLVQTFTNQVTGFKLPDFGAFSLESFGTARVKGIAVLVVGAIIAFASGPISRRGKKGGDSDGDAGPGDVELVIKTIGWLICVLGALITFEVI